MPADPLLRVRDLSKTYSHRRWLFPALPATAALAGVEDARRGGDAGQRQQAGRVALGMMGAQDFGDLLADAEDGVECQQRVLEDHGDLGAADRFQCAFVELQQVASIEEYLSADAVLGGRKQFEKGEG